jgi:metalloendopeptidase OMA1, mitochondrial
MSQGLLAQGLGAVAIGGGINPQLVDVAAQAATLGVILPYSRTQESEADHIGLLYMAQAGYDPREAIKLWQNFDKLGGAGTPEFLSTHPAAGSRIERLQELMPEAMEVYRASRQQQ